jgi:two-component system chemotaxis response regulator CheB
MQVSPLHVVVVGASAGGLKLLCDLASVLSPSGNVAYFFVIHLSKAELGPFIVDNIRQCSSVPCQLADDGKTIEGGNIYVGVPDMHLIVKEGRMKLSHGAMENRWRPSIDVLFRSAAVAYRENATGIILSGLLQDGTAGMIAIKQCGGATIVQDPRQAEYPDMPRSVLDTMEVDHIIPVNEMGDAIERIIDQPRKKVTVPHMILHEATISENNATHVEDVAVPGTQSRLTCPDCGGVLWELNENGIGRFRCYTGHSYAAEDLDTHQEQKLESTLWVALRMMEERKNLLQNLWDRENQRNMKTLAAMHHKRLEELNHHIGQLRSILLLDQS